MSRESHSTPEDRLPSPSTPMTAEYVSENHKDTQYKELHALLNTKD